jgi:hypothetical protein
MGMNRDQAEGRNEPSRLCGEGLHLRWYRPEGLVEGDGNGPYPWLIEEPNVLETPIELQAVGSPISGRKGDASELEFMSRACRLDLRVAKPWGNVDPYDVLVAIGREFWRVQVKCAFRGKDGGYDTGGRRGGYTKDQVDFVAAHLVAVNVWYIVPIEVCEGQAKLHFRPGGKAKYEKYREAWCLLACTPKVRGWKDIPVLCRCRELPAKCAVCPNR